MTQAQEGARDAARAAYASNGAAPGRRVSFMCPGCDDVHQVVVESPDGSVRVGDVGFNGDLERPTFTPSVLVEYGYPRPGRKMCHSFVTDGRIQFLGDCTHELVGQTVDVPEWPYE